MSIVNTLSLESNRKIKINFDGGDLSSDVGLLLIKEFVSKLGIDKLFSQSFKTHDSALFRYHADKENLRYLKLSFWIWTQHFLMPMANRKAEHLTSTIKVTVTIHLFATMELPEI